MKLYKVPRKSLIVIKGDPNKELFFFNYIDGAFSYCLDSKENIRHLCASTEVDIVGFSEDRNTI